jgi:homoserine O-acetyltransferase
VKKAIREKTNHNSIGVVETQYYTFAGPGNELNLESGEKLSPVTLAYETYGTLNLINPQLICAITVVTNRSLVVRQMAIKLAEEYSG